MAAFQEWLTVTDPKLLAETMAEQFRLSPNELEKAQASLRPAFELGMQRAMASPAAWSEFSRAFAAMVPGGGKAVPGAERGRAFMDIVFGLNGLTAAIARRASLFAGIAPDTIQKLMPGLAVLSMETMVRQTKSGLVPTPPGNLPVASYATARPTAVLVSADGDRTAGEGDLVAAIRRSEKQMQADYAREMTVLFERYGVPSKAK